MDHFTVTAGEPTAASQDANGQVGSDSLVGALLKERSRRSTVTAVLDRLVEGGEFVEYHTDGSCWSARIPAPRAG